MTQGVAGLRVGEGRVTVADRRARNGFRARVEGELDESASGGLVQVDVALALERLELRAVMSPSRSMSPLRRACTAASEFLKYRNTISSTFGAPPQ